MSNSDPGSLDMFAGSGSDLPLLSGSPAIAGHQEFVPVPPDPPAGMQLDLTDPPARYQVQPPAAAPADLAAVLADPRRATIEDVDAIGWDGAPLRADYRELAGRARDLSQLGQPGYSGLAHRVDAYLSRYSQAMAHYELGASLDRMEHDRAAIRAREDAQAPAAPSPTLPELLDEVQRLTRYQGRVELGTMWHNLSSPAHTSRPLAVFSRDDGTPLPFYAALHHYAALEAVGASWEEALSAVIHQLRVLLADDEAGR